MFTCSKTQIPRRLFGQWTGSGGYFIWSSEEKCWDQSLQLGAGRDQSLAVLVAFVLGEVLDEAAGQIQSLGLPLGSILVGVAGIEDGGIDAGQRGGNLEVEVRDLLGGASLIAPLRIASMMPRVSLMEIRLPVPFQPVFTSYALAPLFPILLTSSSAYLVGCSSKKAWPKQAEKVGVGSVMPRSVPASLEVKPDRK